MGHDRSVPDGEEAGAGSLSYERSHKRFIDEKGLVDAGPLGALLGQHVAQQIHRLDVALLPTKIGNGDEGDARLLLLLVGKAYPPRIGHGRRAGILGIEMGALRLTAGDLNVDDALFE